MKQLIILSTIFITFFSCSINEKPEFLGIENLEVLESTSKYVTFTADALFLNRNDIGGELQTDQIKVFINDNEMGTISTKSFKVPSKKEFCIPLNASIPTDSIFNNKNISGLIGSLFSKKIKVQYSGDIKYKVFGYSSTFTIDKTEDIKIKF